MLSDVIQSARLPFLVFTPVCVFLGVSVTLVNGVTVNGYLFGLVLLGALLAHIGVNALNEYADYKSGLDSITKRTPFSGGSGMLPKYPNRLNEVLIMAVVSLIGVCLIGVYFVLIRGMGIIPIGLAGLLLIVTYTTWINKHPLLCLVAPGVGFGFLVVVGSQFVLQGEYSLLAWLVAIVPFFLANNLLLLNQYPDIEADATVGRKTFPIVYDIHWSNGVYTLFMLIVIYVVVMLVHTDYLPWSSLMALFPMPLAFFALYGAIKYGKAIGDKPQYLAANVAVTVFTPLLLALSIVVD